MALLMRRTAMRRVCLEIEELVLAVRVGICGCNMCVSLRYPSVLSYQIFVRNC